MNNNIIKNRNKFFLWSAIAFIFSVFAFFWLNLSYWTDMTWWIQIEYEFDNNFNVETAKKTVSDFSLKFDENKEVLNDVLVYKISWEDKFVVSAWFNLIEDEKLLDQKKVEFRDSLTDIFSSFSSSKIVMSKYTNIWKTFWDYIKNTAIKTLIIAIIWIALYIFFAFNWQVAWISAFSFWLIAIITLAHDVVISSWLYALVSSFLPSFKIDTFFITALLTTLWYSINDTIVVFDRIRANLKKYIKNDDSKDNKSLEEVIEISITQSFRRSIFTSLTVLFVLFSIFFFWPEAVKWFVLVMIFSAFVWTFSSLFIASPLLFEFNKNKILKIEEKVEE